MARKKQDLDSMEFEGDEPDLPAMDEPEESVVEPEQPVEPEPTTGSEPFPLPEGDYMFTPVLSGKGHSSGSAVRRVREWLGLPEGSDFDFDTVEAVRGFQRDHALPVSGVVDVGTWNALSARYS